MLTSSASRILAPLLCMLQAVSASESARNSIDVFQAGCLALAKEFSGGNGIFYQNSDVYSYENSPREFWSNTEILKPTCIFRPTSAEQIGDAVKMLRKANVQFAVRGGGHMGVTVRSHNNFIQTRVFWLRRS